MEDEDDVDVDVDDDDVLEDLEGLLVLFELFVELVVTAEVVLTKLEEVVVVTFTLLLFEVSTAEVVVGATTMAVELVVVDTTIGFPSFSTNFAPQIPARATGVPMSDLR